MSNELQQALLGDGLRRAAVGVAQHLAHARMEPLRKVREDISALVLLATLDDRSFSEDVLNGATKALAAVDHEEIGLLRIEPAAHELVQKLAAHDRVLGD